MTIEQIDEKIAAAKQVMEFWIKAREVVANPLFAELSTAAPPVAVQSQPSSTQRVITASTLYKGYGAQRRLILDLLTVDIPKTPQKLADEMVEKGYVFRGKTPAISVNDMLQTLKSERRAVYVGKAPNNAGLWRKPKPEEEFAPVGQSEQEASEEAS